MLKLKKLSQILTLALTSSVLTPISMFAKTGIYNGEQYEINLSYNDKVAPGDAVFIRMKLNPAKGQKVSIPKNAKTLAKAEITQNETSEKEKAKKISSTDFFIVSNAKKTQGTIDLLAALPLSSWLEAQNCTIKITISPYGMKTEEFTLPLEIEKKTFEEEVIPLSEQNTQIRTSASPEKIAQINKLNNIFFSKNADGVNSLESFMMPVKSTRRTSGFADRRTYVYSTGKKATSLHYGVDFGVPEGTEVFACAGGKVLMAEDRISTGYSIVIEHLPGFYSIYYHLSELGVKEGQKVKKGEKIGLSGKTGMVTGPHLHWEVRLNGEAINPDFLTGDFCFNN